MLKIKLKINNKYFSKHVIWFSLCVTCFFFHYLVEHVVGQETPRTPGNDGPGKTPRPPERPIREASGRALV